MRKVFLLLLLCLGSVASAASPIAFNNVSPIHEAFVSRITDPIPQVIVPRQPPELMNETPPPQPNTQMIWIRGYWAWLHEKQDFVWVCGVWRLPPPDHVWSTGYWKQEKGGWIWVVGAWMPDSSKGPWLYSKMPPPAPQNENPGTSLGKDYFWQAGYWEYVSSTGKYQWLSGSWQKFNPKWILEAAHWVWRPEGYLFVPTYWDWPLDLRGQLYDCKNQTQLSPQAITQQLTCCYPNYLGEFSWYWYYYPQYWDGCDCIPIWWGWSDWWAFPWADHWWLWWWWSHDGFPFPPFLPIVVIDIFPVAPMMFMENFGAFPAPLFITPFGVPTLDQWINAINKALGGDHSTTPYFPSDSTTQIIDQIKDLLPHTGNTRPGGRGNGGAIPKPPSTNLTPPAGPAALPPIPDVTGPVDTGTQVAPVPPVPNVTAPETPQVTEPEYRYTPPSSYQPPVDNGGYNPPSQYYPQEPPQNYPRVDIWWNDGGDHHDRPHRDGHDGGDNDGHRGDRGKGNYQPPTQGRPTSPNTNSGGGSRGGSHRSDGHNKKS